MGGPLSTNDGEQQKRSSGGKSPKRGPTRCNSLDLDLSLVPESEEAPSMPANVKSLAGPSTPSGDQRKRSSGKSPKRGPTRCNSLDLDLSLIPEAEEAPTSERAKPPKRSKSFSASSQLSEFKKGESKLRKSSQQKEEVTAAAIEEVQVEAPKEEKPKKVFQFADRLRCKKAVDYSNVDINTIWYSPAEILELREAEQEVQREVSVGYSRACRDSTLLNVEGLYSKKEQLAMSKRRADAKKTVFGFQGSQKGYIDVSETVATEYGDYSRQAIRGAQKRAARLSSHVDILWNPQEDESDDDTWSDEEAMNDDVKVEMPPSLMPRKSFCYRPKVKRNTSNSSLSTTSLSVTSSTSYETLEDGNEEEEVEKEPTVWRSFKRHARRMSLV